MRIILAAAAASIIAMTAAACGGETAPPPRSVTTVSPTAPGATPSASTARTQVAATPVGGVPRTPVAPSSPAGETVEVTGIVGGVNLKGSVIEIRRLQGVAVTQVSVDQRTIIRKAAGGTLAFRDIRTSDRIIARGTLNDRLDTLLASEITVQDVIPGSQPGG